MVYYWIGKVRVCACTPCSSTWVFERESVCTLKMGGNVVRGCLPRLSLHPLPLPHHISRHHASSVRFPLPSNLNSVRLVPLLKFDGCRLLFCLGSFRSGTRRHLFADASRPGLSFSDYHGDDVLMTGLVLFGGAWRRLNRTICKVQFRSPMAGSEQPSSAVHSRPTSKVAGPRIRFCPACGGATEQLIPKGEELPRDTCTACGSVHYQNPKMVVGCLVEHEDKVLLCKRSIEPSYGLWTLPAGYMEFGESAAEGAARETWEEAKAEVEVQALFAQLDIPLIGQSYIIFRAKLKRPHFSPGCESLECALFKFDEIPFEQIAFSSVSVALKMFVEDYNAGAIRVHHGVIDKRPGASPSDPQGYVVRDHICS